MALREAGVLIGLGVLGGLWAAAWGTKRVQRPDRTAILDARTQTQVRLDALRSRTAVLARRDDLPPAAQALVDDVVERQVFASAVLARARSAEEVRGLLPDLQTAFEHLEEAGGQVGLSLPADSPFEGLCAVDPGHGAATTAWDGTEDGPLDVCPDCADAAARAELPEKRTVAYGGRPVPFDVEPEWGEEDEPTRSDAE